MYEPGDADKLGVMKYGDTTAAFDRGTCRRI
jgi:hypothetical protein